MTAEEFDIVEDAGFRQKVLELESHSPESLALTKKFSGKYPPALLATQVSLRQKAREKLPSWYEAGCVFTSRAMEQATNEAVTILKNTFQGKTFLDLTCGLGVDSWNFSKSFSS